MFFEDEVGFLEAKKNINRQGTKILHDIAHAYATGVLDHPQQLAAFCSLLACICEGKVDGVFDEETALIKWSLTKEFQKKLEDMQKLSKAAENIVPGPWPQSH